MLRDPKFRGDPIRLRSDGVRRTGSPGGSAPQHREVRAAFFAGALVAALLMVPATAGAEPAAGPRSSSPGAASSSADLDGSYLWLGPGGGAARIEGVWHSSFGASITWVRVRERAWLGAVGANLGAARWTERDGGRLWLDGLIGSRRLVGALVGVSLGPVLELGELHHPEIGMSGTIWCFAGVVPYLRAGVIDAAGGFVEVGVQLSLPVTRW